MGWNGNTKDLHEQLEEARNNYKVKYYNCVETTVSKTTTKEGDCQDTTQRNKEATEENDIKDTTHQWKPHTTLIVGDSMLSGINEFRLSTKRNVKVRSFPGALIDDMYDYVKPLLKKRPDRIILHIGTNNCLNEPSRQILDKILKLKSFIELNLPSCKVIISNLIQRTDDGKASLTVKKFNEHLDELELDIIDNRNLTVESLSKKGLHLNNQGYGRLAINLIRKLKSFRSY